MTQQLYNLFVPGIPKAQPRPRLCKNGHVYNPDSADKWKEQIQIEFLKKKQPMITKPVSLEVCYYFSLPKRGNHKSGAHIVKPDIDNLQKALMDALTHARVWADDALVYSMNASKYFSCGESGANIIVRVYEDGNG